MPKHKCATCNRNFINNQVLRRHKQNRVCGRAKVCGACGATYKGGKKNSHEPCQFSCLSVKTGGCGKFYKRKHDAIKHLENCPVIKNNISL